jgi:hypothetical protein
MRKAAMTSTPAPDAGPEPDAAPVDRHADRVAALRRAVLDAPGSLDPAIRAAAASPGSQEVLPAALPPSAALPPVLQAAAALPPALQAYVAKVCESAYRISDADLGALTEAGYSEDEIFEVTVAAAFGTALRSLDAGLRAVREGS